MKIDNKDWRRYEALNHILSNYGVFEIADHEYLSKQQLKEILEDLLEEYKEKSKRNRLIEHIRNR